MICVDPVSWRDKRGDWCHLFDDENDVEALHQFAARIGMRRSRFQDHPFLPHYDLLPSKRAAAVRAGAREVGLKETAQAIRRYWESYSDYVEAKIGGGLE